MAALSYRCLSLEKTFDFINTICYSSEVVKKILGGIYV